MFHNICNGDASWAILVVFVLISTFFPEPSLAEDKVFYISNTGGTQSVWSLSISGGTPEQVLSYESLHILSVNISESGKEIAFVTQDVGEDHNTGKLWVGNIDGSNASEISLNLITPHAPVAWSPDDQLIVLPTLSEGLFTVERDGTDLKPLTPPETSHLWDDDPDVSVNGDVVYNNSELEEIRITSLAGEEGTLIRSVTGTTAPQWSPDGDRVLYNDNILGLRLMDRDGSNDESLITKQEGENLISGDWSSSGILYVRVDEESGDRDIWVINPDGSGDRRLTSGPSVDRRPQWVIGEILSSVKNWHFME